MSYSAQMVADAVSLQGETNGEHAEILVATTWQCNLRCSYCFVENSITPAAVLPMSPFLAKKTVDALHEGFSDVDQVCIHLYGGEPLANLSALRAMVRRAARYPLGRFSFAITTNGTLGTPEAITLLHEGKFQVILSIDGPARIHDADRRTAMNTATHHKVMEFLNALRRDTCCSVRGSAVVRSGWSLSEASAYLRTLPVDTIKAQAVRSSPDASHTLTDSEFKRYLDDLDRVGEQVIEDIASGIMPLDDRFSARVLQLLAGSERKSFCGAGRTMFGINPDGTVVPCILMGKNAPCLGRVEDDPPKWRMNGMHWQKTITLPATCTGCSARSLCKGGCPAVMPVCAESECDITRKNCEIALRIFRHFRNDPLKLLILAGIS